MTESRLERHEEPPARDLVDAAAVVYEGAFALPPYSGSDSADDFRDRVARYVSRDGFRLTLCRAEGGEVVGLALSVRAYPGDWWRDRCAEALGPDRVSEWLEPVIREVVHIAVAPGRQRAGIGRSLTEDALDDAGVTAIVLSCHPEAEPAKRMYHSCGFELLLDDFRTAPGQLGFWLLARRPTAER